jgi:hypothetical protein
VSYDVLCAAAMNLFDSLYAHIDTKSLTVPPLWAEKMRESSMRSTVVAGLVEMERPILQVFGGQGATDEVPLGYHAVMEGYARTMTDLAMWLRAKSKPNLVEEHVKNLALRAVQKENIPHYLTWDYVKARFQKSDPVTSEIAIAASYIALMHSNVVEVGEVPLFFRDAKGEHLWKAISQLSDMTHPGRTFLDACKAADTVLPQKKNDGIEILELTNRLCDEMGIPRPELMAAKLRCFLSNLRESMDPLYRSIIFMDALTDRGLRILELASKDLRLGILGQLDPEELSVVMLRNDRVFGDTSVQRFGLILFGSVLEQLFHRDRIVCYEKSRNNQNPFCPSSQECTPETFAPSKRCEGGFLAALDAIVGNYQNLRPPGKAPTPTS